MYIPETIQKIKVKGIWICFFFFLFISCKEDENENRISPSSEKVTISFSLNTAEFVSRAGVKNVDIVNSLSLVVFEFEEVHVSASEYIYHYYAVATLEGEKYTADIYRSISDCRIYLIANVDLTNLIRPGNTEAEIHEAVLLAYPGTDEPDLEYIPMFGMIDMDSGLSADEKIDLGEIPLVRSMASVTVENKADNFILTSMQGYRVNTHLQVIPNSLTDDKVSEPSIPEKSEAILMSKKIAVNEGATKLEGLYLPESGPVTDVDKQTSEATCLIIGGRYNGDETETYYRVDFGEKETFGQLLRNYRYNIVITKVTGPGTTHPDESGEKNIEYTIDDWNDSAHEIEL